MGLISQGEALCRVGQILAGVRLSCKIFRWNGMRRALRWSNGDCRRNRLEEAGRAVFVWMSSHTSKRRKRVVSSGSASNWWLIATMVETVLYETWFPKWMVPNSVCMSLSNSNKPQGANKVCNLPLIFPFPWANVTFSFGTLYSVLCCCESRNFWKPSVLLPIR